MRALLRGATATLALLLATMGVAAAQGHVEHERFYFGFGAGPGWGYLGGDFSDVPTKFGVSGHLRFGWTINNATLVGFESVGWYESSDGLDNAWGAGLGTASWYPLASLPAFVKGGAGWMYVNTNDGFSELTSSHLAFTAGAGYDIKVGRHNAITLVANWIYGVSAGLSLEDLHVGDASPSILQLGVAYSVY